MINKQFKFEAQIVNGSKVVAFTRNTKYLFQGQFDLEGQGHCDFQTHLRHLSGQ